MDEAVKPIRVLAVAALVAVLPFAHAQGLQDPTRPPAQLDARAGAIAFGGPQLQSVLIAPGPGGRQVAVIDGDTVRLGDTWRGARVVRMSQSEIELVRGREHQVLKLNPSVPSGGAISAVKR
jgi:MSHA biogenesis protein MshK